mmetsp:Transcript_23031/g.55525  ORF Transcript_23031/g.55525 Transcript_23031/m.55525 type:complete len:91 (-) Transcript_23031:95-367(-)
MRGFRYNLSTASETTTSSLPPDGEITEDRSNLTNEMRSSRSTPRSSKAHNSSGRDLLHVTTATAVMLMMEGGEGGDCDDADDTLSGFMGA